MHNNYSLMEQSMTVMYCHTYWLNCLCKLVAHADNIQYSDGNLCKSLILFTKSACGNLATNSRHTIHF